MKILIAGAGAVGFHLAELLSNENQDIIVIDTDEEVLEHASNHLDVMTIRGDVTSIEILEQAEIHRVNLFLAVTTSETTNLVAAMLAKKMGARQTIARINNPEYLTPERREDFAQMGVDNLFSPLQLAALEIERLLKRYAFTDVFEFENGKISLIGFTVLDNARLVNKSLRDLSADMPDIPFQAIAILRKGKTIIPHGDHVIQPGDHLYLATQTGHLDQLTKFIGFQPRKMKNIMMVGGSELALATAQLLENTYNITLIDPNKASCKRLIEKLHNTLVVQANPGNIDVLIEEGIEEMDAYIALSPNSETNIITSLLVKEYGVFKTIALVDNVDYTHISQSIGVDTIINKKLIAANNIFRFVRKGRIEAITSLHGVDAEVIEFIIHKENRLVKKPIRDLKIPEGATIVGVVRGEESFIPNGDFQFQLDDKVIVFAMPQCIAKIEALFR